MKSTELRIGNLIEMNISHENFIELVSLDVLDDIINRDTQYSPIPLTEEWWLRLGATYNGDKSFIGLELNGIAIGVNIGGFVTVWQLGEQVGIQFPHIKHVHTFQNFVHALTGNELTISK